ncbi:transposase [Dyadobacter sp. 32]|uniref:transposase n=1 Tax=Dyadobacter sp. 32 TaxID=538966 RepID=UPI0039C749A3
MEDTATDYKLLYEKSLELLSERDDQIQALNFELDKYKRYIFGKKNEKLAGIHTDVNQIDLFELGTNQPQQEELSEQAADVVKEKVPAKKREKGTGRMILPENLRREIIIIEPTEDVTGCTIIGEEVTEVLDLIPAEFYVKRYIRYKYARANGEGIITASLPDRVIDKGIPSEAVIAQMVVDKYVFGLPLHRQIDKYRRMGVNVPASTASDWIMKGWQHLAPLWELLKLLVLNQKYLQADESPLKVLDRDHKNGIHQGFMWIYNAPCDKLTLFDYRKGEIDTRPGEKIVLSARGSADPDKNNIQCRWWNYWEAGSYPGKLILVGENNETSTFLVPSDAEAGTVFHIILEVTDNGKPALTSFRRAIIRVK